MKKSFYFVLLATLSLLIYSGPASALQTTLIEQGSAWQYQTLQNDLWPNWSNAGYNSFNWNSGSWLNGNAAFGNPYSLPYNTYWAANTDLALQKTFSIAGDVSGFLTLNVASDNGFMVFINGTQVAKQNAEGYTYYWEYALPLSDSPFIAPGMNIIQVLAEDHGVATFFDLKLSGDIQPVPEPSTILLLGAGLIGLGFARIKFKS